MTASDSRITILRAARRQFAAHGFARTTVRDIAAEAGFSPALVIKLFTDKKYLYREAGYPGVPLLDLDLPSDQLGRAMVQRIVDRRDDAQIEPWANIAATIRDSPDPAEARDQYVSVWRPYITELIGDRTPNAAHASVVMTLLLGLAEALRVVGLYPQDEFSSAQILEIWAPLVQAEIDACSEDGKQNRDGPAG